MYGAVRKSFPNCLDIDSNKMLELKICYIKILPSKIKKTEIYTSKYGERVLRYRLRLNFYFRFYLAIYLFFCVCVCLAVYDKLINIKRKTTEMSMTEAQHIRHNQINPRQVT